VAESDKRTSLLYYSVDYSRKKIYSVGFPCRYWNEARMKEKISDAMTHNKLDRLSAQKFFQASLLFWESGTVFTTLWN
jgi:hypothetical protein